MDAEVLFAIEGGAAVITLNRPQKRNALNASAINALRESISLAESNDAVHVVLITGAGPDFCAGADISALQKVSGATIVENLEDATSLMNLFTQMRRVPVPVVAAVRGRALAGGCGLATACDLIVAARSARFGYPEVKIGFVPAIVMGILRRNVSEKAAFELVTRGENISADEARRAGLINRVFDDDTFERDVETYIGGFERLSRSAISLSKRLLYHIDGMTFEAALRSGADTNAIARMTEDFRTGVARFLKKEN